MKIVEEVAGLVFDQVMIFKTVVSIIKLETRLAMLSLYPLLLTGCLLFIVSITLWLSTMSLLGYCALLALEQPLFAILSVVLLNVCIFLGLLKYLHCHLKNMSFEKTREYLLPKESHHDEDQREKTNHRKNCSDGKKITVSSGKNEST